MRFGFSWLGSAPRDDLIGPDQGERRFIEVGGDRFIGKIDYLEVDAPPRSFCGKGACSIPGSRKAKQRPIEAKMVKQRTAVGTPDMWRAPARLGCRHIDAWCIVGFAGLVGYDGRRAIVTIAEW